jgi:hypothetical protein
VVLIFSLEKVFINIMMDASYDVVNKITFDLKKVVHVQDVPLFHSVQAGCSLITMLSRLV